jgi:hypothetical protein
VDIKRPFELTAPLVPSRCSSTEVSVVHSCARGCQRRKLRGHHSMDPSLHFALSLSLQRPNLLPPPPPRRLTSPASALLPPLRFCPPPRRPRADICIVLPPACFIIYLILFLQAPPSSLFCANAALCHNGKGHLSRETPTAGGRSIIPDFNPPPAQSSAAGHGCPQ